MSEHTMDIARELVGHGVAWLDSVRPNWRRCIIPSSLDMRDGDYCILGQVFQIEAGDKPSLCGCCRMNGYSYAKQLLPEMTNDVSERWYGFVDGMVPLEYLQAAWEAELSRELANA